MQGLSAKSRQGGLRLGAEEAGFGLEAGAIGGVAQDRMADMGQVDTDLVGAAGFQRAGQEARDRLAIAPVEGLQKLPMSDGLAAALAHRPLLAVMRIAVERGFDGALRPVGRAPDESKVAAAHRAGAAMVGELF